jgi:hypothetical protein
MGAAVELVDQNLAGRRLYIDTSGNLVQSVNGAAATLLQAYADESRQTAPATIATTGNTDTYIIAPFAGTLTGIDFSGVDALAAHGSNYITFSATNLGQAGAGSAAMLAATDANTTKTTTGTAIAANTKRPLTLTATAADLVVAKGDRIRIRAAATGTLTNTVTFAMYSAYFTRTS